MWIILLCVYTSVIISSNAQDKANFVTQANTETSYISNGANIDSTRSPVTVTIRNRQTVNSDQTVATNSNHPLVYSNEWQPILLPLGLNNHGDSSSNLNENTRSVDYQLVPTFLRRPDSEANNTASLPYIQTVERNEFSDVQIPYAPVFYFQKHSNNATESLISDADHVYSETLPTDTRSTNEGIFQYFDLYRNGRHFVPPMVPIDSNSQVSLGLNEGILENKSEPKEVSSSTLQKSRISNSVPFRANEQNTKPLTAEENRTEQEILNPMSLYRSNYRYLPQAVQGYYHPYPFLPIQPDGAFHRILPNPPNDPSLDRESGSEIHDQISLLPEKQVLREGVSDHSAENIPSETVADVLPPKPVPLPVGGYPFGFYPPPFIPPFLPNIPAPGFALNPLRNPPLTHVPTENIHSDASQPLPIVPVGPLPEIFPNVLPKPEIFPNVLPKTEIFPNVLPKPEIFPNVLPKPGNLEPAEQIRVQTDVQVNPEESIPDVEPNATKIPYEFGFHMNDGKGNDQHRRETSDISGIVKGSYGYSDEDGVYRFVEYIADKNGFRAVIKSNEPGVASSGSANVVVMAERPPPKAIVEGLKEVETIAVPDTNVVKIIPGSNLESK